MKIKKNGTVFLVVALLGGMIFLLGVDSPALGADQSTQPAKDGSSGTVSPTPDIDQKPVVPYDQPLISPTPETPAPADRNKEKRREYETQC